jgi:hypothetical protein
VNKKNEVVETLIDRNEMIQIDNEIINDLLVTTNDVPDSKEIIPPDLEPVQCGR